MPTTYPDHFTPDQQYLPGKLKNKRYYFPSEQGFEKQIVARLKAWWGEKKAGLANKDKDNPQSPEC